MDLVRGRCTVDELRRELLEGAFDVEANGQRLFEAALGCEHLEVCEWMVSADFASEIGPIPWEGLPGLFLSVCRKGLGELASRLGEAHPELYGATTAYGDTSLHCAVAGGLVELMPKMVPHFPEGVNVRGLEGNTPLTDACRRGHRAAVEYLLDAGADVNAAGRVGETALHAVCWGKDASIVALLLDHGADVNALFGRESPLLIASGYGSFDMVSLLVEAGAEVNYKNESNGTPLRKASMAGCVQTVQFLFEHGAELDTLDSDGETPLCIALRCGHCEVAEYLLSVGASVDPVRLEREYIEDGICEYDHVNSLQLMLKLGVSKMSLALMEKAFLECDCDGAGRVVRFLLSISEVADSDVMELDQSGLPAELVEEWDRSGGLARWRGRARGIALRFMLLGWRRCAVEWIGEVQWEWLLDMPSSGDTEGP
jgi:uncharacterized protein